MRESERWTVAATKAHARTQQVEREVGFWGREGRGRSEERKGGEMRGWKWRWTEVKVEVVAAWGGGGRRGEMRRGPCVLGWEQVGMVSKVAR